MSKAVHYPVARSWALSLVSSLILLGIMTTCVACDGHDDSPAASAGEAAAVSTTADPDGVGETGGATGEERAASDESAASEDSDVTEESTPSGGDDATELGSTPTWIGATQPTSAMIDMSWARYEEDDPLLGSAFSEGWVDNQVWFASGGHYKFVDAEAGVLIRFYGTRIALVSVTNSACDRAYIRLDGGSPEYVNMNRGDDPASSMRVWTSPILFPGEHHLRIQWAAHPYEGEIITFDAVDVIGHLEMSVWEPMWESSW